MRAVMYRVTDDVACVVTVATRWVYRYVAKQHYRCFEFNVEFVWRQSTECQRVRIRRWLQNCLHVGCGMSVLTLALCARLS